MTAGRSRPRWHGAWAATVAWSRSPTGAAARFRWVDERAAFRLISGARSRPVTDVVGSPGAGNAVTSTATTSNTGRTAARPARATCSCSAATITPSSTRAALPYAAVTTVASPSSDPTGGASARYPGAQAATSTPQPPTVTAQVPKSITRPPSPAGPATASTYPSPRISCAKPACDVDCAPRMTPGIQPELWVDRASAAVAFYEAAFGASVLHRVGEGDDTVAQLAVGDAAFWVATANPRMNRFSPNEVSGSTGRILLVVDWPPTRDRCELGDPTCGDTARIHAADPVLARRLQRAVQSSSRAPRLYWCRVALAALRALIAHQIDSWSARSARRSWSRLGSSLGSCLRDLDLDRGSPGDLDAGRGGLPDDFRDGRSPRLA